ncbi:hypothetical protein GCM10010521_32270 [Streptomyces rameus]|uniref:Uncharacterized protein n=1 Tax=Streptomyces rameus TaxID=68261 RepID=A0ABP6NE21_9ACTN
MTHLWYELARGLRDEAPSPTLQRSEEPVFGAAPPDRAERTAGAVPTACEGRAPRPATPVSRLSDEPCGPPYPAKRIRL